MSVSLWTSKNDRVFHAEGLNHPASWLDARGFTALLLCHCAMLATHLRLSVSISNDMIFNRDIILEYRMTELIYRGTLTSFSEVANVPELHCVGHAGKAFLRHCNLQNPIFDANPYLAVVVVVVRHPAQTRDQEQRERVRLTRSAVTASSQRGTFVVTNGAAFYPFLDDTVPISPIRAIGHLPQPDLRHGGKG